MPGWRQTSDNEAPAQITATMTVLTVFTLCQKNSLSTLPLLEQILLHPCQPVSGLDEWLLGEIQEYAQSGRIDLTPQSARVDKPRPTAESRALQINFCYPHLEELFLNFIPGNGLSEPWFYINQSRTGTPFHFEDFLFDSININHGPGVKIWYTVSRKRLPAVLKLYGDNPIETCGHQFFHKSFAPSLTTLQNAGIPVNCHIQMPGTIMLLEGGTLHSVINVGAGVSEARNFVGPRWLQLFPIALAIWENCTVYKSGSKQHKDSVRLLREWAELLFKRLQAPNAETAARINAARLGKAKWLPVKPEFRAKFPETAEANEVVCHGNIAIEDMLGNTFDDYLGSFPKAAVCHTGKKLPHCETCKKDFKRTRSFKQHVRRYHSSQNQFTCPFCPYTTYHKGNLTRHSALH
ncbi:hypothetical protein BV898_18697 [Hypsibius exemplaris]|uniref:C2H2-type domain-containing protein n=1 Tax=Hypsibius exemplaris TaxID=2072580 RepID=A0A9X6RN93_HYPEX|nr:hypothetical protein BV898_18697 [Hypsibius exemplaris]